MRNVPANALSLVAYELVAEAVRNNGKGAIGVDWQSPQGFVSRSSIRQPPP